LPLFGEAGSWHVSLDLNRVLGGEAMEETPFVALTSEFGKLTHPADLIEHRVGRRRSSTPLFPDTEPREHRIENILHTNMPGDPAERTHRQPQILPAQLRQIGVLGGIQVLRRL